MDGTPRILVASLGDGTARQSFWWFAPQNQPEGWLDSTLILAPLASSRLSRSSWLCGVTTVKRRPWASCPETVSPWILASLT